MGLFLLQYGATMRHHAFEFEDATWLPHLLRDGITDFLRVAAEKMEVFRNVAPLLRDLALETNAAQFVDLCAGGGGPMPALRDQIARDFQLELPLVLTDLYPNHRAFEAAANRGDCAIRVIQTPIDACAVPKSLHGIRTLFNSLHHLRPAQVDSLLADAVAKSQPIAVFELVDRSFIAFASICATPALVFLLTPTQKSRDWRRYFLTYVIPLIPTLVWWDGMASCLRAYSDDELSTLCAPHQKPSYEFRIGRVRAPYIGAPIRYLLGVPTRKTPHTDNAHLKKTQMSETS